MADWASSIELSRGDRVWVSRDRIVDELPSLDLDLEEPSMVRPSPYAATRRAPIEDAITDRPMLGGNRGGVTEPPVMLRSSGRRMPNRAPATPVPLYSRPLLDEGPDPYEKTPPTFDMGLRSATFMEEEPTDIGSDDPTGHRPSPLVALTGVELADYDDDLPSTEVVAQRGRVAPQGTSWHRFTPPVASRSSDFDVDADADDSSIGLDDDISLTLELDEDWLVLDASTPDSRVHQVHRELLPDPDSDSDLGSLLESDVFVRAPARQVHQTPLSRRTPEPAPRLAMRAPAPIVRQPLRSTVPSYLQTTPSHGAPGIPGRVVDVVTFCSGMVVGATCGATIVFLAATAALLA